MEDRLKNMPDPAMVIADKIVEELEGSSKYLLFVPLVRDKAFSGSRGRR